MIYFDDWGFGDCECGIDKVDKSLPHNSWCPKHTIDMDKFKCECGSWHSPGCINRVDQYIEVKKPLDINDAIKLLYKSNPK